MPISDSRGNGRKGYREYFADEMATAVGSRCIHVFESHILEESTLSNHAPTPIGGRLLRLLYSTLHLSLPLIRPPSFIRPLTLHVAYPPIYHSTFHISKTLNHLSVLSRACLAVIDRNPPAFMSGTGAARPTLRDAKRCNNRVRARIVHIRLGTGHSYLRL